MYDVTHETVNRNKNPTTAVPVYGTPVYSMCRPRHQSNRHYTLATLGPWVAGDAHTTRIRDAYRPYSTKNTSQRPTQQHNNNAYKYSNRYPYRALPVHKLRKITNKSNKLLFCIKPL